MSGLAAVRCCAAVREGLSPLTAWLLEPCVARPASLSQTSARNASKHRTGYPRRNKTKALANRQIIRKTHTLHDDDDDDGRAPGHNKTNDDPMSRACRADPSALPEKSPRGVGWKAQSRQPLGRTRPAVSRALSKGLRRQVVEDLRVEDLDRAVIRTRRHRGCSG